MTNNELINIFKTLEETTDNILDLYESLQPYEEEYQKMSIAKVKSTIYEAYELYYAHKDKLTKAIDNILNADFSKIIEQFDVEKLFKQIPEEYRSIITQLLEDYNLEN